MPHIMFVCTGNICRSPMAEALFKDMLVRRCPPGNWRVSSSGTWALDGDAASLHGQTVMAERGLDTSLHEARRVNRELMEEADLVLVMARNHQEALAAEFPDLAPRVRVLAEAAGERGDVWDPYGGTLEEYRETADILRTLLERGFDRILKLAEGK